MRTELQQRFSTALFEASLPPPSEVVDAGAVTAGQRFNVYRNNIHVSLIEALAQSFPVVQQLVGEEFFAAMARVFVKSHLPESPVLLHYGQEFPEFIHAFEPANSLPYLPDVARLELARRRAYHAADAASLQPDSLLDCAEADVPRLSFDLHPSLELVDSQWPIITLWEAHSDGERTELLELQDEGEDALVMRPADAVKVHRLPPGGLVFLRSLQAADTLGAATALARESHPHFDLAINLQGLLESAAVTGWRLQES